MASTITRSELQSAVAVGEVLIVETLGPSDYESGHLPGAINIPHTEVAELAPRLLPDKSAAIVTYCSNEACRNSGIAQEQHQALGYTNVRKYAGGKQDWDGAGLPLEAGVSA